MKKHFVFVGWILLILLCVGGCAVTWPVVHMIAMEWENESQWHVYGDHYTFDSKRILDLYKKGDENLFTVIPEEELEESEDVERTENPPSKWKQQDFLETLQIFHQSIFGNPLREKFRAAIFYVPDCSQVAFGPQNASFFTYTVSPGDITSYDYFIDLQNNYIDWNGEGFQPIISWQVSSVDIANYEISAEEALEIAENYGGQETRLLNQNQCEIDINISAYHHNGNWVVSYNPTSDFSNLLSVEIDKDTGEAQIIARGGIGAYSFDSQNIIELLSEGKTNVFEIQTAPPADNLDLPPVTWTQADYYQIAKAFNKFILHEDLDKWDINYISFELDCNDVAYGLQQMSFSFVRLNLPVNDYFTERIDIDPRTNTIEWGNEYDYSAEPSWLEERNQEVIDQSWIKVPADKAVKIVYETEGEKFHEILKNNGEKCKIKGWLDKLGDHDANSLDWDIDEWQWREASEPLDAPAKVQAFVNIQTGELKFFTFYQDLKH